MKTLGTLGIALGAVLGALAAPAQAAPRADVSVTITAEQTDLSGVVRSARPARCAANRTVVVFRVKGAVGGGDDVRFASDTTDDSPSLPGGRYEWSTGNTGTEGRFYARLTGTAECKPARSGVVRAQRDD
ncbi:hypothetical protein GCM10027062_44020 [Nocardioides hungaricus]